MKLVKSLLLGAGAGLVAVSGASAADLPSRKAAPIAVEYVRVCSTYGVGFFFLPGTNTCVRIGGRVRAEYLYAQPFTRGTDATGFRARGRLNVDARTATDYGTLRAFFRYEITRNTGAYSYAHVDGPGVVPGSISGGTLITGPLGQTARVATFNRVGGASVSTSVDKAFIQYAAPFGGSITAGRAGSFFDFYANDTNWSGLRGSDRSGGGTQVLALTAGPFGGGFSATVAVEDRTSSEQQFNNNATPVVGSPPGATIVLPGTAGFTFAGQRMPDITGNIRYDGAFGSAQLSGAVHELRALNRQPAFTTTGFATGAPFADTEYGYAVQGGVKINLPMLAAGDTLWLQGAYASGAISYLGYGGEFLTTNARAGRLSFFNTDALINANGSIEKTEGFAVVGSFTHYFTPMLRGSVYGSYAQLYYNNSVRTAAFANGAFGAAFFPVSSVGAIGVDNNEIRVGGQLVFSPVSAFDIGVEVLYTNVESARGRTQDTKNAALRGFTGATFNPAIPVRTLKSDDAFQARLRLQRDF